ncbi:OmpA family protein [sulfur-oxidizing endosymbiont of Gigantopelta aegis]|uniref:OmpA family protein n=1 Tax=sulfur-oxidizing endosymbiont of Gigantopelta aegis TaxID=2794934 RepID=UPI0018DDC077|nr:OmpA family protein [sulfur-oxidizing endosymbiont of Gigantopelta aegis]
MKTLNKAQFLGTSILLSSLFLGACTSIDPYTREEKTNNTVKGAGIGALSGAILGVIAGDSRKAALIGAGVGALAGGGIGYYMDQQEAKLRRELEATGVSVTRVGDSIILNMPGNITFKTGSSAISADFYPVLGSVAKVINEYAKTYVDIYGHTDSVGQASYNMTLSQQRASSVSRYLQTREVLAQRIMTRGLGEDQPIASNDTAQGRSQNRRVEIRLTPLT